MSRRSLSSRLSIRASWPFARAPVFDTPKTIIIPRLPPEVIEAIIDHISDKHSLKSCSLVSTAFLGPSQKRLFTNITLRRRTEEDNPFSGFHDLITQKSHILANLITSLNLIDFEVGHTTWFLLDTGFIPRILASVPNLTHIGIQSERRELSPQIQDALNGVYAACPLTSVSLRGLRVDLPDILRRCLFLREVGLADIELIADTQPSPCAKEWVADTTDLDAFCASPKLHPTSSEPITAFTLQAHISQFVFQLTRTMGPSIIDDILHSSIWVSLSRSLRVLELDLIHFRHTDALQRLLDATSQTVHELRICTFDVGSLAFQIPPSTTNVVFHFKFAPGFCKTNPSFVDIFQPFNKLHRHRHASEGLSDVRIQLEVSAHSLFDRPAWEWAFLDEILICVRKVVWVVITLVTPGQIMDEMRYAFADRVSECLPRARQKQVLRVMVV